MKKLQKLHLNDAKVLESKEMKMISGGYSYGYNDPWAPGHGIFRCDCPNGESYSFYAMNGLAAISDGTTKCGESTPTCVLVNNWG